MAATLGKMSSNAFRTALCAAALLGAFGAAPSRAGEPGDQDRARRAVESGEVLPLQTILKNVRREYPGEVMDVDLDRKDGRWIYQIKLLRPGGTLLKLKVDGRDGSVLHAKEKAARDPGHGGH